LWWCSCGVWWAVLFLNGGLTAWLKPRPSERHRASRELACFARCFLMWLVEGDGLPRTFVVLSRECRSFALAQDDKSVGFGGAD